MSGNIDTSAETIERVRKELAGAMTMIITNRDSSVAQTRLKRAIIGAHSHGQLTDIQTEAMIKLYDLADA